MSTKAQQSTNLAVARDPESELQAYSLTLQRKKKAYGSVDWELMVNGETVGKIPNGGQIVINGTVGDVLEVSFGENLRNGRKTKNNTFELVIKRPGNLTLKLKQTGDTTVYICVAIFTLSVVATSAGFVLGLIPLVFGLVASGVVFYKYAKAGWREISPCRTGNEDLHNGAIEHVTTRGTFWRT